MFARDPPGTSRPSCGGVVLDPGLFSHIRAVFARTAFSISVSTGATSNVCTLAFNALAVHSPASATTSTPAYSWFKNIGCEERTELSMTACTASASCSSVAGASPSARSMGAPAAANVAASSSGDWSLLCTRSSPLMESLWYCVSFGASSSRNLSSRSVSSSGQRLSPSTAAAAAASAAAFRSANESASGRQYTSHSAALSAFPSEFFAPPIFFESSQSSL
mmetsp:Transcript_4547/g.16144  ORF Transcript_4547/g.16144 Transcript_4547/m.16144 type:complete len:221 (+) Transcript_4547:1265-1927(+)